MWKLFNPQAWHQKARLRAGLWPGSMHGREKERAHHNHTSNYHGNDLCRTPEHRKVTFKRRTEYWAKVILVPDPS